jgi:tetratricopeptide (TPR) repeat protein
MPIVREQYPIVLSIFTGKGGHERAPVLLMGIALCLVAFIMQCSPASCETFTASYWLQKGDAFYANDSYELAVKCYDKAIEIDSKYFLAWNNKGRSLFNMGQFEDANLAYDDTI